ncbi:growth factor receptor-bound protein 2 [Octopus bimaculoides]|nr:growth factor receptor-bound protein 2 [Octopus bimaculoides]|eukprot:XP_014784855.1 PREDICTED: growth factor receptor-bound protein 2-like [Octopus bimaculoides]
MEAVAKYDFKATASDELSFLKGSILKILSMDEEKMWYKAEQYGSEGYVPYNYIQLKPHPWFITKKVTRAQAEKMLLEKDDVGEYIQPDGAFLVRHSESSPGEFSISVKFRNEVQHYKVLRDGAGKYFLWVTKFSSLNAIVDYHRRSSVSRGETIFLIDMLMKKDKKKQVKASFDFDPQYPEELQLQKGEIITVLEKKDENWWRGENTRGVQGLFPATYVCEIQQ